MIVLYYLRYNTLTIYMTTTLTSRIHLETHCYTKSIKIRIFSDACGQEQRWKFVF